MDRVTRRNLRKRVADFVGGKKGKPVRADASREFGVSLAFVDKAVALNK